MELYGRGQRSGLVRWAGMMNGLRITAKVMDGSRNLWRELHCQLDRAGAMPNIMSQWQDPEILFVCSWLKDYII